MPQPLKRNKKQAMYELNCFIFWTMKNSVIKKKALSDYFDLVELPIEIEEEELHLISKNSIHQVLEYGKYLGVEKEAKELISPLIKEYGEYNIHYRGYFNTLYYDINLLSA